MFIFTFKYTHCRIWIRSLVFQMDFRRNEFIIIVIYIVYYAHGLSEQIHKQCALFTFSTVAFFVNTHGVLLVRYFLNLSVSAHAIDVMVYQCHYAIGTTSLHYAFCKDSNLVKHFIQSNLKVKHVWNLISYAGNKTCFSRKPCFFHSRHLLQLHLFLTFSCFSTPNPSTLPSITRTTILFPTWLLL